MSDHTAGVEGRARCDAPHAKAKGPRSPFASPIRTWAEMLAPLAPLFGPPVLQPGTKVRLRTPVDEDDDGPFVVMGVITEHGAHGTSVRYRIGSGSGDGFEVAPELVEPVPEPLAEPEPDSLDAMLDPEPEPAGARFVEFNQIAPNLMESECGRFRVTVTGGRWSAFDTWTGETSPASMERGPALEWVARRAGATVPPLNWRDGNGGPCVTQMGTTFEVFFVRGKWKGFDPRFTAEAFGSPIFPTLNKAKEWCAVRAMCESQPLPSGSGARPVLVV